MEKSHKIILAVFSIILAVILAVTIFLGINRLSPAQQEFIAPPFDENAVGGAPIEVDAALNYRTLEIEKGFTVSVCGNLTVGENGQVDVFFSSDKNNTVWTKLVLLTEDGEEIGSTGLLKPNEYVQAVQLSTVPSVTQNIIIKILSYEPETYLSQGSASAKVVLNVL